MIAAILNHFIRGRPWRYSVIPSTPDFLTEYQIRRNSNPAGLPVFPAILVPGYRASTIILTHMFKQIKLIRITLMAMFKVHPGSPDKVPVGLQLICTQRRGTRSDTGDCGIVYSARGFSWLLPRIVWMCDSRHHFHTFNCNEVGSPLPHRSHISRSSCLKNPGERNDVLEFSIRVLNV